MTAIDVFVVRQAASGTNQPLPARDQLREQIRDQVRKSLEEAGVSRAQATAEANVAAENASKRIRIMDNGRTVIIGADAAPAPPALPAIVGPPGFEVRTGSHDIPPEAVSMAYGLFAMCAVMVVGWPIARAFGRRIERTVPASELPAATSGQLQRIEQAVEAMAIEVERISESQRFMAKIQGGSTAERV